MRNSSKRKPKRLKRMAVFHFSLALFATILGTSFAISLPREKSFEATEMKHNIRNQTHEAAKDSRGLFSPRMDYDQWKPLGRGDPLQNDPTYDYVPPVLDRVHYWIEPPVKKQETPPPHEGKKSEILVLGVSSKKPSTSASTAEGRKDPYESFLKFIDGPKFYHHHNSFNRPNQGQRPSHPMSHNFHPQFFKNKYDDEQRMPYTVLVPPPIPPPHMELPLFNSQNPSPKLPQTTTQRPVYKQPTTTTAPRPSVSVQEANLIYHSSSTGGLNQWNGGHSQYASQGAGSQYVTWRTPTDNPPYRNSFQETVTKGNPIIFTKNSTESIYSGPKQVSKPIMFPTETTGRIVFEQHSLYNPASAQSSESISHTPTITQTAVFPEVLMAQTPLVLAPTGSPALHMLHVAGTQPAITHMAVGSQPMHKGQVSDDTIGNTYVNIGKPNAHIQKEVTTDKAPDLSSMQASTNRIPNNFGPSMMKPMMQMPLLPFMYPSNQINSVYTSHNTPAMINNGIPFSRRPGPITEDFTLQTMQTMQPPPPISSTTEKTDAFTKKPTGLLYSLLQKETSATTAPYTFTTYMTTTSTAPTPTVKTSTTTAVASLTTDPLFKHYKQPMEPLRGPMYLIIQGHSKVKTYGASHKDTMNGISMPETNEIPQAGDKYPVKHLHTKKDNYKKEESGHNRSKNARTLKDLLDKGIGNLDVQETELGAKYEVGVEDGIASTEKYYKGIVESEEIEVGDRITNKITKKNRQKRQLDEFLPVIDDAVETIVYDYLKRQSEGSGVGAILASAITSDSADYDVNDLVDDDEDEQDNDVAAEK